MGEPSSPEAAALLKKYQRLGGITLCQAEYVWIGGSGEDLRSKCRTLARKPQSISEVPEWNFDGSSTGQAPGDDSEVILKPATIFPDPFRGGDNVLILCECYDPKGNPLPGNNRAKAREVFDDAKVKAEEAWYGLEQEYTLFAPDRRVLGWPKGGFPGAQGPYYCGVGANAVFGRPVVEAHYKACLYSGINISGVNGEVMPGQWEFQVGPCEGISSGDQLWMARYILHRIGEEFNISASFDPKPIPGDWNGAGAHCNYSTKSTRAPGGLDVIYSMLKKMEAKHKEHIDVYGEGNEERMTGAHETSSMDKFTYGVANRGASVRIPRDTEKKGCGYFEDRRPAANIDPYVVTAKIAHTTILC